MNNDADQADYKRRLAEWVKEQPMSETYAILEKAASGLHRLDREKHLRIVGMQGMLDHIRNAVVDYALEAATENEQILPTPAD